jgi:hypothetical protein
MLDYTLAFILTATHRQVERKGRLWPTFRDRFARGGRARRTRPMALFAPRRSEALIPVVSIRAEAHGERRATGDKYGTGHCEVSSQA